MIWILVVTAGIITFCLRYSMIAFIKPETLSETTKKVLTYVPSAVFPAMIFPAVLFNEQGQIYYENNVQILAILFAIVVGYLSKNTLITILAGLIFYWLLIFI